jgi:hypothetical protein
MMKGKTLVGIALLCAVTTSTFAVTKKPSIPVRDKEAGKCLKDSDCKAYPGTVCILITIGDYTTGKCTPNYGTRPVCRGGQAGLCPQYQSSTAGYLNTQCVLVDKSMQPATDSDIVVPSNRPTESPDLTDTIATTPANSTLKTTTIPSVTARFLADIVAPVENNGTALADSNTTIPPSSGSDSASGSGLDSGGLKAPAPRTPVKDLPCPSDEGLSLSDPKCWFGTSYKNKTITVQYRCVDYDMCLSQSAASAGASKDSQEYCRPKNCVTGTQQLCNNRGTCQGNDPINAMDPKGYTCRCYAGYTGLKCDKTQNTKDCDVDCGLGGACIDNMCSCYEGFLGKDIRCSKCTSDKACENGNKCNLETGKCDCKDGYVGDTCGGKLSNCAGVKCTDGGFPDDTTKTCSCNCPRLVQGAKIPCDGLDCSRCEELGAGEIAGAHHSSLSLVTMAMIVFVALVH